MKLLIIALTLLVNTESIMAAGSGPASLVPPFTNVSILLIALVFFLRKPLRSFFSSKSTAVSEMIERASSKAKEAEAMMEIQKKKTSGVDAEIKKLEQESEEIVSGFENKYKSDIGDRIISMKEDAGQKIEAEKKQMIDDLNADLLDQVIVKAKTKIKADAKLTGTATENILQGL